MTVGRSSTVARNASLTSLLRALLQDEGFNLPHKIRFGVAIRLTVRGIQLGQTYFELRIGRGRGGMGMQVIPEANVPPMFVTALWHNVQVVRAGIALAQ